MSGTVICPVHNALDIFEETYHRVLQQLLPGDQIVIVDDQSDDPTQRLQKLPGTHFLSTLDITGQIYPNLALAVNLGLNRVRPEDRWALILESDVWLMPSCLAMLKDSLENDPSAGLVTPLFLHRDCVTIAHCFPGTLGGSPPLLTDIEKSSLLSQMYLTPLYVPWVHFSCCLISGEIARNPLVRCDPLYRLWCADFDYAWTLEDVTHTRLKYEPSARAVHQPHQSSRRGQFDWTQPPHSLQTEAYYNRFVREKHHRGNL